ncbi:hypothetical protein BU17DRAFT_75716 [Hysterangium stoloniferum]|nr:hypothetical protein BU17DRAFT_75716 [Hysterangium stoloniferum]
MTLNCSSALDTKDGISLLSLKHHMLLSYMQSLTLLSAHRILGHSLSARTQPPEPFTHPNRGERGNGAGDVVDTLLEDKAVLEKVKQLENKMRYQIEKLVKIAEESVTDASADIVNDPLVFRPNPQNLQEGDESEAEKDNSQQQIYRPPRLAPMPYIEKTRKVFRPAKSGPRAPVPVGLASIMHDGGLNPHTESTSGLGIIPSMASSRARELTRMTQFEEENMTRLVMTKKEARRRVRDEGDVALGGSGVSKGRSRGGGLGDEFDDLLRTFDHGGRARGMDDGYEALRVKGRKQDALSRSRTRDRDGDDDNGRPMKKGRFQTAVKVMARKKRS